jgi:Putative transposase
MTISALEFLRRFTQHILPRGFVRIRQFGYLTNTRRAASLALARELLDANSKPPASVRRKMTPLLSGAAPFVTVKCVSARICPPGN